MVAELFECCYLRADGNYLAEYLYLGRSTFYCGPARTWRLEADEDDRILWIRKSLREVMLEFLKVAGYAVLDAGNASEALEIAEGYDGEISLLITDVVLPGINGRALAERLVSRRPGTKVLYISGYTDDAVVRNGVLQSDIAFLKKPFSQEALALKVREILDAA